MARAYYDESGNEDRPGYFGIAGFVGTDHQWRVLEAIWRETLDATRAPYLHMREFAHSTGAFDGWKDDRERRERLMAGLVQAVNESRLTAVGSAMRTADFDALAEERVGVSSVRISAACRRSCTGSRFARWTRIRPSRSR